MTVLNIQVVSGQLLCVCTISQYFLFYHIYILLLRQVLHENLKFLLNLNH